MGLFKTKKKTIVNTSVSRMVADEDIVPSNKMAVLDYTLSQNSASTRLSSESLTDYLLKATTNNIVARARKSRTYAKKDSYYYGLPESSMIVTEGVDIKEAITEVLNSMYPQGVIVKDAYFGPMNNFYFLRPILQNKYGYNYDTNELVEETRRIGFPCYMESAQIIYSQYTNAALVDPDTLMQYGESAEAGYTPFRKANPKAVQVPWVNNGSSDHDIARVTVVYADAVGAKQTYTIDINFLDFESSSKPPTEGLDDSDTNNIDPDAVAPTKPKGIDGADFYQANYEYMKDGVPHKDTFIYLYGSGVNSKLDNLFSRGDKFGEHIPRIYARLGGRKLTDEEFKDTPEYKSMVGICRQMGMNWVNWVDEVHKSVGSLDSVTQIYMTYSLPANTTDPLIQDYLFSYFETIYGKLPNTSPTTNFGDLNRAFLAGGSKQGQSYEIKDKGYTQRVGFDALAYVDISGSIGAVGTTQSGMETKLVQLGRVGSTSRFRPYSSVTMHYYRKQLTSTTYREYQVYGLTLEEIVQGGDYTRASGGSEELLLPIDLSINHGFSIRQLEVLYTKAMYIVLNTLQVVKTKWYQTGIFKVIMIIIAIVLSYFFPPAGVAVWTWMAAAYAVVQAVVIALLIQVAVKLLVKLGVDVGTAAAVLAVVAVIYGGFTALTKTTGFAGMSSVQILQLSSQAFSASSQGFALQTKAAIKEFNSLMTDLTEEQKELQRKARELGMGNHGPLLMFEPPISIGVRIGESPDDYFERSIHTTNIASTVYSLIETHVDMGLQLPTSTGILRNLQEQSDDLSILGL